MTKIVAGVWLLCMGFAGWAQNSGASSTGGAGVAAQHRQENAASAQKDTSGASGDQVTKPAGAKSKTVIGCLAGPDGDGHYTLNSMRFRSGVQVLGPDNLSSAAGQKVKLTGDWVSDGASHEQRRFQATRFDVMADKCPSPTEKTPVGKKK